MSSYTLCEMGHRKVREKLIRHELVSYCCHPLQIQGPAKLKPLIARFMGQHGANRGPTGPRWVPWWPHELCSLGLYVHTRYWLWQEIHSQESNTGISPPPDVAIIRSANLWLIHTTYLLASGKYFWHIEHLYVIRKYIPPSLIGLAKCDSFIVWETYFY